MQGTAEKLFRSDSHSFSKFGETKLTLVKGIGIEGDVHSGEFVKHRSRAEKTPQEPNLRQVHLLASELLAEMAAHGFSLSAGDLGENISTQGLTLIDLPRHAVLHIGDAVKLQVEGLRNPCSQIEVFQKGLLQHMTGKNEAGDMVRKTGIMCTVLQGGEISEGAMIEVTVPDGPHVPLVVV